MPFFLIYRVCITDGQSKVIASSSGISKVRSVGSKEKDFSNFESFEDLFTFTFRVSKLIVRLVPLSEISSLKNFSQTLWDSKIFENQMLIGRFLVEECSVKKNVILWRMFSRKLVRKERFYQRIARGSKSIRNVQGTRKFIWTEIHWFRI